MFENVYEAVCIRYQDVHQGHRSVAVAGCFSRLLSVSWTTLAQAMKTWFSQEIMKMSDLLISSLYALKVIAFFLFCIFFFFLFPVRILP